MNINCRIRTRLVQVLSSDLSSAQDVYSENGKVVRRAAVEALVRELVDKYGFRLRLQKAVGPIKVLIVWKWVLHARMQEMPHSTSTWQAGGQPITQRASCCLHRTSEHHRTAAYPRLPVPKIAALPRVHPPKLPMYSQSRAAA